MKAVIWSSTALAQYKRSIRYLNDRNPDAALRLAQSIREAADGLGLRPAGRPGYVQGTFEKVVPKTAYIIVFDVVGEEVQILRLFHMAQNWRDWQKRDDTDDLQ